jgi:uncharacterized membrane protein
MDRKRGDTQIPIHLFMEEILKSLSEHLAQWVEAAAALVIGLASIKAFISYITVILPRRSHRVIPGQIIPKDEIRISLARSLALALEFTLGADILKTAVAPTWEAIGMLAAIAVLRTLLNYFLEKELQNAEQRKEKT